MGDQSLGTVLAERSEHRWHYQRRADVMHRAQRHRLRGAMTARGRALNARGKAWRLCVKHAERGGVSKARQRGRADSHRSFRAEQSQQIARAGSRSRVPSASPAVAASEPHRSERARLLCSCRGQRQSSGRDSISAESIATRLSPKPGRDGSSTLSGHLAQAARVSQRVWVLAVRKWRRLHRTRWRAERPAVRQRSTQTMTTRCAATSTRRRANIDSTRSAASMRAAWTRL